MSNETSTTLLPEMEIDENDKSTTTLSRGPKTIDDEECCKCPTKKDVDVEEETTTLEDEETTTIMSTDNSTMKDRGGRTFGDSVDDNEIETSTTNMTTLPDLISTTEAEELDTDSSKGTSVNFSGPKIYFTKLW